MDWLDLLAIQDSQESCPAVQEYLFFGAQLSLQSNSHPYMTTGKTKALTRRTFVGKVMFLLFNMLPQKVLIKHTRKNLISHLSLKVKLKTNIWCLTCTLRNKTFVKCLMQALRDMIN